MTRYRFLELEVDHTEKSVIFASRKDDEFFQLSCSGTKKQMKLPIALLEDAIEMPRRQRPISRSAEIRWRSRISDILEDDEVLRYIQSLPTPMFLGLDRTTRRRDLRYREPSYPPEKEETRNVLRGSLDDSLREATQIATDAFQKNRRQQDELTATLRTQLILAAFEYHDPQVRLPSRVPKKSDVQRIDRNFDDVKTTLLQLGIEEKEIDRVVLPFFSEMKQTIAVLPNAKSIEDLFRLVGPNDAVMRWLTTQPQQKRIDAIILSIASYNDRVRELREPIRKHEEIVNRFVTDSGKRIRLSEYEKLKVGLPNLESTGLMSQSSGERQVVVILTRLIFNEAARSANVLIIDKPEISLHVRWQEILVDSLQEANPETQIILATHSPSIILDRTDRCVDL